MTNNPDKLIREYVGAVMSNDTVRVARAGQELARYVLEVTPTTFAHADTLSPKGDSVTKVAAWDDGDSSFEGWFADYDMKHKGTKQQMREAYAAGMGDTQPDRDALLQALRDTQVAAGVSQCPWCGVWGVSYAESERPADYCHHEYRLKPWQMFAPSNSLKGTP